MRKVFLLTIIIFFAAWAFQNAYAQGGNKSKELRTYCNPMNLNYRFCLDKPSRREAADPTLILFKDEYYLFASKSGGYWHSNNLLDWELITTQDLPIEEYAPTAVVIKDTVYFVASGEKNPIFKTGDPKSGKWKVANSGLPFNMTDPDLFYDDDGRLYLYWGCSNKDPLYVVELDLKNNLQPISEPRELFGANVKEYGWERPGDDNTSKNNPWFEGSWMNKYNGKYYLQFSVPGTEFKSYADGVYISENPFGPFVCQRSNPFSLKQGGFVCGAGHGSTFQDKYGNYWHIATQTISIKHMFERRLGIFPTGFDKDGVMFTQTAWGDYPQFMPVKKNRSVQNSFTGWMLLSYKKNATASSAIDSLPATNAFDENIRTYWSAKTGSKGEWISVDLGRKSLVKALQINFAEHETNILGRHDGIYYQYKVECSSDGVNWNTIIDKSNNVVDAPHDYIELSKPASTRYIKLINIHVPDGTFAVSGLRVFGNSSVKKPKSIYFFKAARDLSDTRDASLKWERDKNATGYVINYGVDKNKLYNHLMIYENNYAELHGLTAGIDYYFSINSFNEGGISKGNKIIRAKANP